VESEKRILVIETVEQSIAQLEQLLAGRYRISVAFNNSQGFEEAKSADKPDLILISALNDVVESYALCRQLKNDMKTYTIPVLFILDRSQELAEYRGFEVGAADYLPSPLVKDVVLSRIDTYLKMVELERKVEKLEVHDSLTGLYNRSYFENYFKQEWLRARRSESPLGLMLIEIDGFDEYNEHYGHAKLEDILKRLAAVIQQRLYRPADLLARNRVKGFACVLPDTDHPGLRLLAEQLMAAVCELGIKHEFAGQSNLLTVSIAADYVVPDSVDQYNNFYNHIKALLDQRSVQNFGSILFLDS
jgi:diguanylate cyclase (GGDEF)-like protein